MKRPDAESVPPLPRLSAGRVSWRGLVLMRTWIGRMSSSWLVARMVIATLLTAFVADYHALWAMALWGIALVAAGIWQWVARSQSPEAIQRRIDQAMHAHQSTSGNNPIHIHCFYTSTLPKARAHVHRDFVFVWGLEWVFNMGLLFSLCRSARLAFHWRPFSPHVLALVMASAMILALVYAFMRWYVLALERQAHMEVGAVLGAHVKAGRLAFVKVSATVSAVRSRAKLQDAGLRWREGLRLMALKTALVLALMLLAYVLTQCLLPYYSPFTQPHILSLLVCGVVGLWVMADVSHWLHHYFRQPFYTLICGLVGAVASWMFLQNAVTLFGGLSLGVVMHTPWLQAVFLGMSALFGLLNARYTWYDMRESPSVYSQFCQQTHELSRSLFSSTPNPFKPRSEQHHRPEAATSDWLDPMLPAQNVYPVDVGSSLSGGHDRR